MKRIITKAIFACSLALMATACIRPEDNSVTVVVPAKVNEAEEIGEVRLAITDDAGKVTTVSYLAGSKTNPEITLLKDKTYSFELKLFKTDKSDTTKEIIDEKEEHFFTYEFADTNANLQRDAKDEARKDGTKIGLRTTLKLAEAPKATSVMKIKLFHKPSSVSTTGADQRGTVTGGATDAEAIFNIK
jgi:hypothetical protein